ncbi:MAG: endonuclease/exonuclease/phosphatase family protein [Bacteroidales bacterium]
MVKNKIFRIISIIYHSTLLSINLLFALLLIGAAFNDRVPPESVSYLNYLGMAFPLFAAANLFFLIYWIYRQKWYSTVLSLGALIISGGALFTYCPVNYQKEAVPENCIKLLSYNVRQFNFGERDKNKNNPTLEHIATQGADIICLQEFGYSDNNSMLRLREIRKRLKEYPYYHVYKLTENSWHTYGIACFSKFPLSNITPIKFEKAEAVGAIAYTVTINKRKIRLFNCHLESNRFTSADRKLYQNMVEKFTTDKLEDFNSTIVRKMDRAFSERARQARKIRREMEKTDLEIVTCGDFNDTPLSYTYRTIKGDSMDDAFVNTASGLGISYYENHFYFRIDHILYSKNLNAYQCKVENVKYSDHYPISCFLKFKN